MVANAIRIGERFGVPVMLLCLFIFFTREACQSFHGTVLMPIVDAHVAFLKGTTETQAVQSKTLSKIQEILGDISHEQKDISDRIGNATSSP